MANASATASQSRRAGLIVVIATLIVSSSCSLVFRQPEVRFDGLRVGVIGLRGGTAYARFHVFNPNGYALQTTAITYDLELSTPSSASDSQWTRVASGTFDEQLRIASDDSASLEIPIEFQFADLSGALGSIINRGSVDYRVSGRVSVDEPMRRTVPYRRTGTVDIMGF